MALRPCVGSWDARGGATILLLAAALVSSACSSTQDTSSGAGGQGGSGTTTGTLGEMAVSRPASGEVIVAGTQQRIAWQPTTGIDSVDIYLTSEATDPITVTTGAENTGTYDWQVPLVAAPNDPSRVAYRVTVVPAGAQVRSNDVWYPRDGELGGAGGSGGGAAAGDPEVAVGALAAFKWNGTTEDYYWIDMVTGETRVVGTVGDLMWWSQDSTAADSDSHTVYVAGSNEAGESKLYTLDTLSGELVSEVVVDIGSLQLPLALSVSLDGQSVLGFRWNGATEDYVAIDSATGAISVLGTVGDLEMWSTETALDRAAGRMYVIGTNHGGTTKLYVLDAGTGDLLSDVPLVGSGGQYDLNITGLAVSSAGTLLGFRYNFDQAVEEMVELDPTTGAITVRGTVGDLLMWSSVTVLNPSNDNLYVVGITAAEQDKLYTMDAATGELLYSLPIADYPTEATLVY